MYTPFQRSGASRKDASHAGGAEGADLLCFLSFLCVRQILGFLVGVVAGAADHGSAGDEHPIPRRGTVTGQAKRRVGGGVGCGRGPSAFFAGGTHAAGAPREPAATDIRRAISWRFGRTEGGTSPGPADAPALPAGSTAGQARGKDARQVEASASCGAYAAGKVSARIQRYSPLRELATARRQALPHDGPSTFACSQICDEPISMGSACGAVSSFPFVRRDAW